MFESQVIEVGLLLRRLGVDFSYEIFEGLRTGLSSRPDINREIARLSRAFGESIDLHIVPAPLSNYGLRIAAHRLAAKISRCDWRPLFVFARGEVSTCTALKLRRYVGKLKVVFDARGDSPAEAILRANATKNPLARRRWEGRAQRLAALQRYASAHADHIIAVSTALREHLIHLGDITRERTTVIPCCIDPRRFDQPLTRRKQIRAQLDLGDRLVFVYSGSMALHQIPARVREIMTRVLASSLRAHLLVVSREESKAKELFGPLIEIGACTVISCAYELVADYLLASDVGLLLREDNSVNRVACPIKFVEYQAAGLPVIISPRIGDVSNHVLDTGHGLLVELEKGADEIAAEVIRWINSPVWPLDSKAIAEAAILRFSRQTYFRDYRNILIRCGIKAPWLDSHS